VGILLANSCLSLAASVLLAPAGHEQMPTYDQAGPIPPALTAAKTIFLSNPGADPGPEPIPAGCGQAPRRGALKIGHPAFAD